MQRRGFLKGFAALIGGVALEQAIPFGRVWSFPKEIKCVNAASTYATYLIGAEAVYTSAPLASIAAIYYNKVALDRLADNFKFIDAEVRYPLPVASGNIIRLSRLEPRPKLQTYRFAIAQAELA